MYPIWLIAGNNLKKKKGDAAVLFFLTALSVLLLYISISVLSGTEQIFDRAYEAAHAADAFWIIEGGCEENLSEFFVSQEEVTEFERSDLYAFSNMCYRKEKDGEGEEYSFLFGAIEDERNIGRIPNMEAVSEDAILLPYYLKMSAGYAEGDSIWMTFDGSDYEFRVAGFVEDPLFSTPVVLNYYSCYISRERIESLITEGKIHSENQCGLYKMRLQEGTDSAAFQDKTSLLLANMRAEDASSFGGVVWIFENWAVMKDGGAIMSNIGMGIILVFSVMLILISLIIVRFSIRNFVERNIKNIGILKASGYTSGQLQTASVLEMGLISGFGILTGLVFGEAAGGIVGNLEGMMLGLGWNGGFDLKAAVAAASVVLILVMLTTYSAVRRYRKITVLDALRGGIHTHNFRKNYFPIEKSRLPGSLIMSGKHIFGEKIRNVSVLLIVFFQAFAVFMAFTLYQNFAVHTDGLMKFLGLDLGDVLCNGSGLLEAGEEVSGWEEVEKVIFHYIIDAEIRFEEKTVKVSCDVYNDPELLENHMLIEGRNPEYENEIIVSTAVAKRLGVKVGDLVYVKGSGAEVDYIVCGIDQQSNNMGIKAALTEDGDVRLNGVSGEAMLMVYLEEGTAYEEFQEKFTGLYGGVICTNSKKIIEGATAGVVLAMAILCIVFVVVTVLVVFMVEILLIKSQIIKERRNYGIQKAVGYTTGQLIRQSMMMHMPVILAGGVLGVAAGVFLNEPLVVLCFSYCSLQKCELYMSPFWGILTIVGILAVAMFAAFACSLRIRKIEPVKLLAEE